MVQPSSLDIESRVYGPQSVCAVLASMARDGIAPQQLLEGSGLEQAALRLPDTRVSYAQIARVLGNAVHLRRTPSVALQAGLLMRLTAFGMYSYALLSSASRDATIDFAVKYNRIIGPLTRMSFTREEGVDAYRHEPLLVHEPGDALYQFFTEFALSAHLALCRDLYGESFDFSLVRLAYPEPGHGQAYRQLFQCPVHFGQPVNEVQIGGAWGNRVPRMPDPVTHALAQDICEQLLADLSHSGGAAAAVRRVLLTQLPGRFARIELMAEELAMHPRTLRRRLQAQGTSYRQLLTEVRHLLALDYLRKTRMSMEEIASRLGYSDASNFRHAFGRWTGRTPNEYRNPSCVSAERSA